jgi:hypothetical protein
VPFCRTAGQRSWFVDAVVILARGSTHRGCLAVYLLILVLLLWSSVAMRASIC